MRAGVEPSNYLWNQEKLLNIISVYYSLLSVSHLNQETSRKMDTENCLLGSVLFNTSRLVVNTKMNISSLFSVILFKYGGNFKISLAVTFPSNILLTKCTQS